VLLYQENNNDKDLLVFLFDIVMDRLWKLDKCFKPNTKDYKKEMQSLWSANQERNWFVFMKNPEVLTKGRRVLTEELQIQREQIRTRIINVGRLSKHFLNKVITQILSMDNVNIFESNVEEDLNFLILPLQTMLDKEGGVTIDINYNLQVNISELLNLQL
jgi:hypothetical protein